MPVIPTTQLSLMRKRRELKELMEAGQWEKIIEVESDLHGQIDNAVLDPHRSSKELLNELGEVIKLYRELSDTCYLYSQDFHQPQR